MDVTKDINEIRLTGSITDATARDYEVRMLPSPCSLAWLIVWICAAAWQWLQRWNTHSCMHAAAPDLGMPLQL